MAAERADNPKPGDQSPLLPARQFGEYRWTARAKETSASVFLHGIYPPTIQALLEFTDNSVGFRDRTHPDSTKISIVIDDDRINVTDYGGFGSDAEGIKLFAAVGETSDMGIGFRGAGAKFAGWFLGEDLELTAKRAGETVEYLADMKGFGDPNIPYSGTFIIDAKKSSWEKDKGRFEVLIRRLKKITNLPQGASLRRALAEVYRPLLPDSVDLKNGQTAGRVVFDNQGTLKVINDKVSMFVTSKRKREQVIRLKIPLVEGYGEDDLRTIDISTGEKMWFWVGEMDLKNPDSKNVKPGIRFYFDGRLVTRDHCGFDEKDPRLAGLVGEVHLDNLVRIKEHLSVNKSAGIDQTSGAWKQVVNAVNRKIAPFVEQLQSKPLPTLGEQPKFVAEALSAIRKIADVCVREMANEKVLIDPESLSVLVRATSVGQRRPSPPDPDKERGRQRLGKDGKPWHSQRPVTIQDLDADPALHRLRESYIDGTEVYDFDNPTTVSQIIQRTKNGKEIKILALNSGNPTVNLAIEGGKFYVMQLAGGELAHHMAMEWTSKIDDYLQFRDEMRYRIGLMLYNDPAYHSVIRSRRANERS